jgi:alkanesulfonate monooxygenase SsuD/methylene tetrahydromethanopterin reductase-like flavin-dependent oxidoreductase (luciferase family)
MEIGIGLPNHVAGVSGNLIAPWARRSEERGFDALTTIDRLIYPSVDSVVALAVAAGATTAPRLVTNVLLAPLYPPVMLAKHLASVALCSAERLVVGLGVGNRQDDYASAGVDFDKRGKVLDEQITTMRQAWSGAPFADDTAAGHGAAGDDGRRGLGRRRLARLSGASHDDRTHPYRVARCGQARRSGLADVGERGSGTRRHG